MDLYKEKKNIVYFNAPDGALCLTLYLDYFSDPGAALRGHSKSMFTRWGRWVKVEISMLCRFCFIKVKKMLQKCPQGKGRWSKKAKFL